MLAANGHVPHPAILLRAPHAGSHRYSIESATPEHVYALAAKLRPEDCAEIIGSGNNPKRSLWRGFRNSVMCETAFVDGEVAAMWGLCVGFVPGLSLLGNVGRPWLLTSAAVEKVPFAVVREAKRAVFGMLTVKPVLENYVLASYTRAVRLVRLVGFTVDETAAMSPNGVAYLRFSMTRPQVMEAAQGHG
jgi:hypothetical protein